MKTISTYISEKLKISSKPGLLTNKIKDFDELELDIDETTISSAYADAPYPDERFKRIRQNGTELLWWKWWKILAYNGPTTKGNLNKAIGNNMESSYSTIYARLNKLNVITYNTKLKCLEAQPVSKWKV